MAVDRAWDWKITLKMAPGFGLKYFNRKPALQTDGVPKKMDISKIKGVQREAVELHYGNSGIQGLFFGS